MTKTIYRYPVAVAMRPREKSFYAYFTDFVLVLYYGGGSCPMAASGVCYPGNRTVFDAADLPHWKFKDAQERFVDDMMGVTRQKNPGWNDAIAAEPPPSHNPEILPTERTDDRIAKVSAGRYTPPLHRVAEEKPRKHAKRQPVRRAPVDSGGQGKLV